MPSDAEVRAAISTAWLHRNVGSAKWQCPRGKVLQLNQGPNSKSFMKQHCAGAKHNDWVAYGKQVMEPFVSGGGKGIFLLPGIFVMSSLLERCAFALGALAGAVAVDVAARFSMRGG